MEHTLYGLMNLAGGIPWHMPAHFSVGFVLVAAVGGYFALRIAAKLLPAVLLAVALFSIFGR